MHVLRYAIIMTGSLSFIVAAGESDGDAEDVARQRSQDATVDRKGGRS